MDLFKLLISIILKLIQELRLGTGLSILGEVSWAGGLGTLGLGCRVVGSSRSEVYRPR